VKTDTSEKGLEALIVASLTGHMGEDVARPAAARRACGTLAHPGASSSNFRGDLPSELLEILGEHTS
jgi:hypothetical protein